MVKRFVVGLIGSVLILLAVACDGTAAIGMVGPDRVDSDEVATYVAAIEGATPLLAFAYWWWFIDLDGDRYPDSNELLTDRIQTEIDRFGQAYTYVQFAPEDFFGEEPIPTKMTVSVRAQLYWSNLTEGSQTLRDQMEVRVNTDN